MASNAETLRCAANRCTRTTADVALLCEHALSAADRLDVLEREHQEFFERWHDARRLNDRLRPVLAAAVALVCAPAWAGISDEDVALEQALRDAGMVMPSAGTTPTLSAAPGIDA